jgi:hypothetical protein
MPKRATDYVRRQSSCQAANTCCRRNMRSSSFRKVESSALMRHGGNERGVVDDHLLRLISGQELTVG